MTLKTDIENLVEHWYDDKQGRALSILRFEKGCKDGTINETDQLITVIKMQGEDILVLRWFIEKLLLEMRNKHARDTGTPD
jgi:hypothetical protein